MDWFLECQSCGAQAAPGLLPTVCACGQPWLVRYRGRTAGPRQRAGAPGERGMWRFRRFLALQPGETPVSLGEGDTPLLAIPRLAERIGLPNVLLKDESTNPTGSFKARGLSAAITRAALGGARGFTLPTAGNAGVAAAAYGARAGLPVRVYAPRATPRTLLDQIVAFGGDLHLIDGHIGDCGRASRRYAEESGAFDLSTLREPYRIEGKKTLGLELAETLGWELPDAILYPTGGGTGLIGMWKAFLELRQIGWIPSGARLPRMFSVQASGCAPIVRAFDQGRDAAEPWTDPRTVASGLRVPGPLGDRLMLRILRESGGGGVAVDDGVLEQYAREGTRLEGVDFSPEGGATVAAAKLLRERGVLRPEDRIVLFNTGAGWLYRSPAELPGR